MAGLSTTVLDSDNCLRKKVLGTRPFTRHQLAMLQGSGGNWLVCVNTIHLRPSTLLWGQRVWPIHPSCSRDRSVGRRGQTVPPPHVLWGTRDVGSSGRKSRGERAIQVQTPGDENRVMSALSPIALISRPDSDDSVGSAGLDRLTHSLAISTLEAPPHLNPPVPPSPKKLSTSLVQLEGLTRGIPSSLFPVTSMSQ